MKRCMLPSIDPHIDTIKGSWPEHSPVLIKEKCFSLVQSQGPIQNYVERTWKYFFTGDALKFSLSFGDVKRGQPSSTPDSPIDLDHGTFIATPPRYVRSKRRQSTL